MLIRERKRRNLKKDIIDVFLVMNVSAMLWFCLCKGWGLI